MPSVCLISTSQVSINPRLVKEADALHAAGYDLRVVTTCRVGWALHSDQHLSKNRQWKPKTIGPYSGQNLSYHLGRIREKICRLLRQKFGDGPWLTPRAFDRQVVELASLAGQKPADLYIAHNLGALPAAVWAAQKHNAKLGFDCEDFHSGQEDSDSADALAMCSWLEEQYIPKCNHVTASSKGIAKAYADKCKIDVPTVILNVFPIQNLPKPTTEYKRASAKSLSLYWFSQTIGPRRGLEDIIKAVAEIKGTVHLHLRGNAAEDYKQELLKLAGGKKNNIHFLAPAPADDMIAASAVHDVGLALETNEFTNKNLAVSNKIFTYLPAGLAVAASDTAGQRNVMDQIPEAGFLYKPGDHKSLAEGIQKWVDNPALLESAKKAAAKAGKETFNWEMEQKKFLAQIEKVIGKPS